MHPRRTRFGKWTDPEDLAGVNTMKLDRAAWKPYFEEMTRLLEGRQVYVEAASLSLGDQVQVEWAPLRGITYDPKNDLFEVLLDELDHLIRHPKDVHVGYGDSGVEAIEIVDGDDTQQIIRLRAPLELPAPGGTG